MPDSTDYRLDRRILTTTTLDAPSDEKRYWLSKTPIERLEAIQWLREMNYGEAASARIQRILTTTMLCDK